MSAQQPEQDWTAESYVKNAGFVSEMVSEIWAMLDPKPNERILDLGCGDGRLTLKLQELGCSVKAIDSNADMIASSVEKGLDAHVVDGQNFDLEEEFDAIFSNAALHWMINPDGVLSSVRNNLKLGGRFVAEFGGFANVAAIVTAMRAAADKFDGDAELAFPWYFPTETAYAKKLEEHGFDVIKIERGPRLTPLPTGMAGWLSVFRQPFFDQFPAEKRSEVISYVEKLLETSLRDEQGNWWADYARIRVHAVKA